MLVDSLRKNHPFQLSPCIFTLARSCKNLYMCKLTLAGSKSLNVTYGAWGSHTSFSLLLYRPDTSVHTLNVQVRCVHYIHRDYQSRSKWTSEWWQWKSNTYSPKNQDWSLTIRYSLMSYPEHSLKRSYPTANVALAYSITQVDRAVFLLSLFILILCSLIHRILKNPYFLFSDCRFSSQQLLLLLLLLLLLSQWLEGRK